MLLKYFYNYKLKHGSNAITKIAAKLLISNEGKRQEWLRLCGMKIGEGSYLSCGLEAFSEPYMVSLGKKVYVAGGYLL